jgi:hypothetical protein
MAPNRAKIAAALETRVQGEPNFDPVVLSIEANRSPVVIVHGEQGIGVIFKHRLGRRIDHQRSQRKRFRLGLRIFT